MGTPKLIDLMNVDPLMSEEIFGPLLPIVKVGYRQACEIMQKMEHALGLYIFSTDKKEIDESMQDPPPLISRRSIAMSQVSQTLTSTSPLKDLVRRCDDQRCKSRSTHLRY